MSWYKAAVDRTDPVGGTTSIADEYRALERLYDAAPEHVPEPGELDVEDGEAVGYSIEEIDGTTLQDLNYGALTAAEQEDLVAGLEDAVDAIHVAGVPHGDVCTSNIVVDADLQPYLIDPAGFGPDHPEAEAVMDRDRQNMDYITGLIERR